MRLWIDTDVGDNPDDAVALLCAAAHPDVEVAGVSTTGGDTAWRAELARALLDAPVIAGGAPDELAAQIRRCAPDALLAIGPLTNVAALVVLCVPLPPLTLMGGALAPVFHRGRVRRVESNFARDPAAASVVVSATDACIVPLDVTVAMRLSSEDLAALCRAAPRLEPELARWTERESAPVVLHDPLALLVATGERVARQEVRPLVVVSGDGTVRETAEGRFHSVVVAADASRAKARVLDLVAGR